MSATGQPAVILQRCKFVPEHRGGPGYWYELRLAAGKLGRGQVLQQSDCWEEDLKTRVAEMDQVARKLNYAVVEVVDKETWPW
jgi:hypothetical protein